MSLADCLPINLKEEANGLSTIDTTPSGPQLMSLRRVFDACDENRDGFLTLEELCEWMKKLDLHLTREGLQEIIQSCDRNLDGRLDFDEFITLSESLGIQSPTNSDRVVAKPRLNGPHHALTEDSETTTELKEAFLVFDKDCNGFISPSELRSTLSQLGLLSASTSFSRIHSMIRRVDTDGDGEVNFSEFQSMMKGIEGCA